jgi:hypothetical protein
MAAGPGIGGLLSALLPLVGIVTVLRGRRRRRGGLPDPVDPGLEARRAATRESERRMSAYLAQRNTASYHVTEDDEQEIRR